MSCVIQEDILDYYHPFLQNSQLNANEWMHQQIFILSCRSIRYVLYMKNDTQ